MHCMRSLGDMRCFSRLGGLHLFLTILYWARRVALSGEGYWPRDVCWGQHWTLNHVLLV